MKKTKSIGPKQKLINELQNRVGVLDDLCKQREKTITDVSLARNRAQDEAFNLRAEVSNLKHSVEDLKRQLRDAREREAQHLGKAQAFELALRMETDQMNEPSKEVRPMTATEASLRAEAAVTPTGRWAESPLMDALRYGVYAKAPIR